MSLYEKLKDIDVIGIDILNASEKELKQVSDERVLGLSLGEMKKIRDYFRGEGRNPTDVELEAFAQSWSEHCCYKTSRPILKETVFNIKAPQNICVISEDAGVVDFDEKHAYVLALESHNHPSALDPYGGAATGIGGILRDVVCMGAQPIALIDPLFFGSLDFPYEKLPDGVKHPRYLLKGVVQGIADYGNRVGIPTVAGMVYFDDSYVGNCLVNVGCVGIIEKKNIVRSRAGNPKDVYILAGGKTGRDGIHGVTFASTELTQYSEKESRPAVQLGYAIMKEPLTHACLEANEEGLLTGFKDFGGGGLSCVSAEMAHAAGLGAVVNIDDIPLKEPNLPPWEIWVSESQERMMLCVKPENVEKVLEIFDFWDVPAAVVGEVIDSSRIRATYQGVEVINLDLDFLISGVVYDRPYKVVKRPAKEPKFDMPNLSEAVMRIISSPNIGSKEFIIRRYDHEVRGNTVLTPLQGAINKQTHGDAAVMKPLSDSFRGLAITCDVNPSFCKLDPYWGAASAVEEVIRNLVSVNSIPHSMADCLNFGNPEKKDRLGDFREACKGLYHVANYFGIPFVSGNVSFYNEHATGSVAPTPTLLGVGIVKDVRNVVSSDLKREGNALYLVGETKMEMGGSQYYKTYGLNGGTVPHVDLKTTKENMDSLLKTMDANLIRSCHDLSDGGLCTSVIEMSLGGDLGVKLELEKIGKIRTDFKLFSESNGRWLVEVEPKKEQKFERVVNASRIGEVLGENRLIVSDEKIRLNLSLKDVRDMWNGAIQKEE